MPAKSKGVHRFDQEKKNRRVEWKRTLEHQERREQVFTRRFKNKHLQGYPTKAGRAK